MFCHTWTISKGYTRLFFNIFEKTQARKNSTDQKTQGFFRPKLNELVVIVAKWISKLILFSAFFAVNEPKLGILGKARRRTCYIWYFLNKFPTKHSHFFKYQTPKLQNSSALERKTSRALGLKLKHFEKKIEHFGFKTQRIGSDQLHLLP